MWKRQLREVKELPQSNTTREWWGRNGPAFPKGAPVPWAPGIALGPLTYSQGKKQELGDPRPGWSLFGGVWGGNKVDFAGMQPGLSASGRSTP